MILYLFAEIKCHNCYYILFAWTKLKHSNNTLVLFLPNYQARSMFVLKHTTSMYICMYGWYVCPLNARAGNFFLQKTRLFRLDHKYILKLPFKSRWTGSKTLTSGKLNECSLVAMYTDFVKAKINFYEILPCLMNNLCTMACSPLVLKYITICMDGTYAL